MSNLTQLPSAVTLEAGTLKLLDQRLLPDQVEFVSILSVEQAADAIKRMVVRGAPAIGIAAAHALAVEASHREFTDSSDRANWMHRLSSMLIKARPTAVNLAWAVQRMVGAGEAAIRDGRDFSLALQREAEAIHLEDRAICRGIGAAGLPLITPNCGVLTHCNAGALAVSELGTATAPLYLAHQQGVPFRVFADETRPVLQGARLTAWELAHVGIDVTLICDNMAASLMSQGLIDLVIVGTDRVTANGDVVNKIGTLSVAIAARHFGIQFYVACPSSTFDPRTERGSDVVIEERAAEEVTTLRGQRIAAVGTKVKNPAFDVTPHTLVSGIITEHGIAYPPFAESLRRVFA